MKTQSIGKILDGRGMTSGFPCVYAVKDDENILYIGRTIKSVSTRIEEHLNLYNQQRKPTKLGMEIENNLPESRNWIIQIYSVKECLEIIHDEFPHIEKITHKEAEIGMILIEKPPQNIRNNTPGTPLPRKFRSGTQLRLENF